MEEIILKLKDDLNLQVTAIQIKGSYYFVTFFGAGLTKEHFLNQEIYKVSDNEVTIKLRNVELTYEYYDDELDQSSLLPLDESLIDCIDQHGYAIVKKLGSGAQKTVFKAIDRENKAYALLIPREKDDIWLGQQMDKLKVSQNQGLLTDMTKIYDPIICPHYRVEVVELVDMSLAEKIIELYLKDDFNEKVKFIKLVDNQLIGIMDRLRQDGYMYNDLKVDNMGLIGDRVVLIDIDSARPYDDRYRYTKEKHDNFIDKLTDIFTPIDEVTIKYKNYEETGLAKDENEQERLRETLFN